jgi:hypothetical protein
MNYFLLRLGPGAMVGGGSPGNPVTSGITLPGSGTTVFPLPGSFPWAAGARGRFPIQFFYN